MSLGQLQLPIAADLHHIAGLYRRGCRCEDYRDFLEMSAHHRHVPGVVLDAFFLLEARFMGLVDDDQAKVGVGQEQRGARTHDNPRFAAGNCTPCPTALRRAKVAVPGYRFAAEPGCEASKEGLGQRDLGEQDKDLHTLPNRLGDGLEIDFGLARTGDAVEQDRVEAFADRSGEADRGHLLLPV